MSNGHVPLEGVEKLKIIVDAMGSDHAPGVEVEGSVLAARAYPQVEVVLSGPPDILRQELRRHGAEGLPISILPASQTIGMGEQPLQAVKQKKDSSLMVAVTAVKEKKAQALVSAGNTGAVMAASLLTLGRIPGVLRPALPTPIPNLNGTCVFLDCGANVDCKPQYLVQFAVMGSLYAREIFGIKDPRVGLLSVGEEKGKGNALTAETYPLLERTPLRFIGNVEGRDIINGKCDVVVCDGFIGNVVLKFAEGMAATIFDLFKHGIEKSLTAKLGAMLLRPVFRDIRRTMDYNEYGGTPLLGIDGVSCVCHGSSKARGIQNAIRTASELVDHKVNAQIQEAMNAIGGIVNE